MKRQAYELWPFCKTNYVPLEKQFDEYALDDDIIFTNKSIIRYRFDGIERDVQSWAEMYVAILRMLHEKNRTILNYYADADDKVDLANHFARAESAFNRFAKIDEGVYVLMNTSTQYKINLLQKYFEVFGEAPENLVFLVKESVAAPDDADGRFKLRHDFWTQAIPVIRDVSGTFTYVSPTTSNTIQGASGYTGVSYQCIANFDSVRVELYIGNPSKSLNKSVYDIMITNQNQIESEYGASLMWDRMDENIASKVCDRLDGVSIANEADWLRMIDFLSQHVSKLKVACQSHLESAFNASSQTI